MPCHQLPRERFSPSARSCRWCTHQRRTAVTPIAVLAQQWLLARKLLHATARDAAGMPRPSPYGGKALGRVTFTADGRMMSVVCDGRKELPAGASREYSSYCGNYTFDGEKLVTRVDAASDLSRNGGDQVRGCASKARTWSSFPRHGEPAGSRNTARSPGNASRRSKAAHSLTYCEIRARNG